LFQLGGPDSLAAVEPFLFNLFCDPDIIDFPFARIGRRALAKLISAARAKKAAEHYAAIGGGSPIRKLTERQAQALENHLHLEGIDARCVVAMRYWHPFTAEAIAQLEAANVDEVVLLPLYPQYSGTTTGSSLNEWHRQWKNLAPTCFIGNFFLNVMYLDAWVERINETLTGFNDPPAVQLVFSAHSVPVSVIEKGDPYQWQIEKTVALIMQRGGWSNAHRLCYQSKVGASRWLQPSLHSTLRRAAAEKVRDVCVVPVSFVSDHVETLAEIDQCARHEAQSLGIERFRMTPGLNDSPMFINALTQLVMDALERPNREDWAPDREGKPTALAMAAD